MWIRNLHLRPLSFPRLPIQFFCKRALSAIASLFGTPLRLDEATTSLKRPSIASIQVEVDVLKDIPTSIWIGSDNSNGFWQKVEVEKVPLYCSHCWHLGHNTETCHFLHPELKKGEQNAATVDKATKMVYRPKVPQVNELINTEDGSFQDAANLNEQLDRITEDDYKNPAKTQTTEAVNSWEASNLIVPVIDVENCKIIDDKEDGLPNTVDNNRSKNDNLTDSFIDNLDLSLESGMNLESTAGARVSNSEDDTHGVSENLALVSADLPDELQKFSFGSITL